MDQGRRCADFSESGTSLSLSGSELRPIRLFPLRVKFPLPATDAGRLPSGVYEFLCIRDGKFEEASISAQRPIGRSGTTTVMDRLAPVALTSDASINTLYIDGMVDGTVPASGNTILQNVGGPWARPAYQRSDAAAAGPPVNNKCSLLDDMFVFDKQLTPVELEILALVRLPSFALLPFRHPIPRQAPRWSRRLRFGISTEGSEQARHWSKATATTSSLSAERVQAAGSSPTSAENRFSSPTLTWRLGCARLPSAPARRHVDIGPGSVAWPMTFASWSRSRRTIP